jgi:hypothetical protein
MRQSRIDAILSLIDETLAEMPEPRSDAAPSRTRRDRSGRAQPTESRPAA